MMTRDEVVYWILYRTLLPFLYKRIFNGAVKNKENVPGRGPLLIASNHSSYIDTPILAYAIDRPVVFLAKEQLFRIPVLSVLLQLTRCIKVSKRCSHYTMIRRVEKRLLDGYAVAIYPEGTRTKEEEVKNIRLGTSYISAVSQAKILPVALVGTGKVLPKGSVLPKYQKLEVRIGTIIEPPLSRDRLELIRHAELIKTSINGLLRDSSHDE